MMANDSVYKKVQKCFKTPIDSEKTKPCQSIGMLGKNIKGPVCQIVVLIQS